MKNDYVPDVCQYMVNNQLVYYTHMEELHDAICDTNETNNNSRDNGSIIVAESTQHALSNETFNDEQSMELDSVDDHYEAVGVQSVSCDEVEVLDDNKCEVINTQSTSLAGIDVEDDEEVVYCNSPNTLCVNVLNSDSNDRKSSSSHTKRSEKMSPCRRSSEDESTVPVNVHSDRVLSFSKTSFEFNEVIEGSLCEIITPTRMTLLIEKISGVSLSASKEQMHNDLMLMKCARLPELNDVVTGE